MRKLAAVLTALSTVALMLAVIAATRGRRAYVPQSTNRAVLNFNTHWLFAGEVPGGAGQAVGLDESGFVPVSLPYSRVHPHKGFPKGDFEVPVSWYRRHFTLPAQYSGRRVAVEFQGVAKVADVYVNGTLVGQHKGAYTSFTFDITPYVSVGGADNVIAVKVDSMTRNDLPPEGGAIDYYVWGGIVRDVNMIVTDPVDVDWAFLTTPNLNTVNARTRVRNDSAVSKSVTVVTQVVDATNNVVATGTATQTIAAQSAVEFSYNTSTIANPNTWHPDHPYLYTVYTQVRDGSTYVDEHRTRLGIRTIQFNRTDGRFYLNGQALKLRGLDRHESYPYIGRAAPNRLQVKDADILKRELGVNIVRTSHYPQDPEFLDRADEIGLLVHGGDTGLAVHRQHRLAGHRGGERTRDGDARPAPPLDRAVGRADQRVRRQPQLLHPHQRSGPPARPVPSHRRRAQLQGQRVPRGRLHLQRLLGYRRRTRPCSPG